MINIRGIIIPFLDLFRLIIIIFNQLFLIYKIATARISHSIISPVQFLFKTLFIMNSYLIFLINYIIAIWGRIIFIISNGYSIILDWFLLLRWIFVAIISPLLRIKRRRNSLVVDFLLLIWLVFTISFLEIRRGIYSWTVLIIL